jgi:hypothetical protein
MYILLSCKVLSKSFNIRLLTRPCCTEFIYFVVLGRDNQVEQISKQPFDT